MCKDKYNKAINLRKQGRTYNEISRRLNIPKSTLSSWFKGKKFSERIKERNYSEAQKIWSRNITRYNKKRAERVKERNLKIQFERAKEIRDLGEYELKLIGASLYWAEGYKRNNMWKVDFSNSDPWMVKIMMRFFREVCKIPEDKFTPIVHLYSGLSAEKAVNYWSKITEVPSKQFQKSFVSKSKASKNKRVSNTLPYGTLHISVNDTYTLNTIFGWIKGLGNKS